MYNTLKEIQDSLSEKELFMYADKAEGKTPEEVVEMFKTDNIDISIEAAKEGIDYLKGVEIVSDEELENVTGGTCYSSGVKDPLTGRNRKYAIVSPANICPINYGGVCWKCAEFFIINGTWYCRLRWKENDPAK